MTVSITTKTGKTTIYENVASCGTRSIIDPNEFCLCFQDGGFKTFKSNEITSLDVRGPSRQAIKDFQAELLTEKYFKSPYMNISDINRRLEAILSY